MRPQHHVSIDTVSNTKVCHSVLVSLASGAYVESLPWPGRLPQWGVYTAGGENVHTYGDVSLAVTHALLLHGDQLNMGAWDGPEEVLVSASYQYADKCLALWNAIASAMREHGEYAAFGVDGKW